MTTLIAEQKDMEIVGRAGDGGEAVEPARELQPNMIIVDVAAPVTTRDKATLRIKAELPQMRIVALSMSAEPGVREKMLDAGGRGVHGQDGTVDVLAAIRDTSPRIDAQGAKAYQAIPS